MECDWCGNEAFRKFEGENICRECDKDVHKCNGCNSENHVDELATIAGEYYCFYCTDDAQFDYDKACVEHSNHIASTNAWLDIERGGR